MLKVDFIFSLTVEFHSINISLYITSFRLFSEYSWTLIFYVMLYYVIMPQYFFLDRTMIPKNKDKKERVD